MALSSGTPAGVREEPQMRETWGADADAPSAHTSGLTPAVTSEVTVDLVPGSPAGLR